MDLEARGVFDRLMAWRTRPRSREVVGPTAQENYKAMLDQHISPALRRMDFKGSGGRYELPSDSHWALIGFQKSVYSDRNAIRFTVNVCVIGRGEWARMRVDYPFWPERPNAGTRFHKSFAQARISELAGREDKWWELTSGTHDVSQTGSSVVEELRSYALPWMRGQLN